MCVITDMSNDLACVVLQVVRGRDTIPHPNFTSPERGYDIALVQLAPDEAIGEILMPKVVHDKRKELHKGPECSLAWPTDNRIDLHMFHFTLVPSERCKKYIYGPMLDHMLCTVDEHDGA